MLQWLPTRGAIPAVSSFLMQWFDPALTISADERPDQMTKEEVQRLIKLRDIAASAAAVPRRLGADASQEELAADKRRSRRVMHVAQQCIAAWGTTTTATSASSSSAREAAQVDWKRWWQEHRVWLVNRIRYIATWSQQGGDEKWAKSACVRLTNELGWLEYAMRDD